jgi:hypothetical protein
MREAPHLPTPAQIRRRCEQIQAGWAESERRRRAIYKPSPAVVPIVHLELDEEYDILGDWAAADVVLPR